MSERKRDVFAIVGAGKMQTGETKWLKAGSAWLNRDGGINIYLDVLPLDGKLHIRESFAEAINVDDAKVKQLSTATQACITALRKLVREHVMLGREPLAQDWFDAEQALKALEDAS